MSNIDKSNELMEKSKQVMQEARDLENQYLSKRAEAIALKNEALSLICPFGVGDIIEYEQTKRGATKTHRMLVQNLDDWSRDTIEVRGMVVKKDMTIGMNRAYLWLGKNQGSKFVRVLKERDS